MRPGTRLRRSASSGTNDGQIGFLEVSEEGTLLVRLDRGTHKGALRETVPYREAEWDIEPERKLTPLQRAMVAYAADRALRELLGEFQVPEWRMLTEGQRAKVQSGPRPELHLRHALWQDIVSRLEKGAL